MNASKYLGWTRKVLPFVIVLVVVADSKYFVCEMNYAQNCIPIQSEHATIIPMDRTGVIWVM